MWTRAAGGERESHPVDQLSSPRIVENDLLCIDEMWGKGRELWTGAVPIWERADAKETRAGMRAREGGPEMRARMLRIYVVGETDVRSGEAFDLMGGSCVTGPSASRRS